MSRIFDAVIIGAGVQGLSLAYNLACGGMRNVAVIEKSYLGSGASGRNGELIRSAFASREWIGLFDHSLRLWENLAAELDFNMMFTRRGYLVLAPQPDQVPALRNMLKRQRAMGLRTTLLDPADIRRLVPALDPRYVAGGILQHNAGFARHDGTLWAYARAARRLGVRIYPFTEVTGILVQGDAVTGVRTTRGEFATRTVVNAAGAHAARIAAMAGRNLPLEAIRNEAIATEPIKPFLWIALSAPALGAYMHQSARGEFVGGAEVGAEKTLSIRSSAVAARVISAKFVGLFPGLGGVRLMRQWAGSTSKTPDSSPLLGPVAGLEGFLLNTGWGGYGFMGAPGGGEVMARHILTGKVPPEMQPFLPDRFERGAPIREAAIIGKPKEEADEGRLDEERHP